MVSKTALLELLSCKIVRFSGKLNFCSCWGRFWVVSCSALGLNLDKCEITNHDVKNRWSFTGGVYCLYSQICKDINNNILESKQKKQ